MAGAPTTSYCPMVVWTGTQMLVVGGGTGSGAMTAHAYNPATDTWTQLASTNSPANRWFGAPVWTGTDLVITGGGLGPGLYYFEGYRYNPATGVWTNAVNRSGFPRWGQTNTIYNGIIYAYAGAATAGAGSALVYQDLYKFSLANNSWTGGMAGPKTRNVHSSFLRGNLIYHFGGVLSPDISAANPNLYPNDFDILDATTETWTTLATTSPVEQRGQMASAYTGSKALFFGGNRGNQVFADGAAFDPATNTWAALPTLNAPSARRCAGAVWTGNAFIVWGGVNAAGQQQVSGHILRNFQ